VAAQLCAEAEEADSVVGETQGCVPTVRQSARGAGDRGNQPYAAGVGELLCGGTCERVLLVYQRLGRKEDPAASEAGEEAEGLRLEAVE
jgi:hypothetical protein